MGVLFLRRIVAFVLLVGVLGVAVTAGPASDPAADALASIPPCGLECITENLPAIGCGLLDIECQCTSPNSTKILQPCLEERCTYEQTFGILRAQATLCNRPHDSRTNTIRVTAYVSGLIPVVVIVLRFASRFLGGNELWWDDWLHLVSVVMVVPMTACLLMNVESGLGRHIWDLTYPRVFAIGRWTYIATMLWGFELLLVKYSILCLYLRIFPNLWLKRVVYGFMAFTAAFTLPLLGLAAFQCIPVSAIWDLAAQRNAKCVDWIAVLRLTVVYEIIAEIVLFSLPVPIVLKLQMKTAKKVQLMVFFSLGICVIAVAIARVPYLPGVVDTTDPTYTVAPTSILGFAGSGVAHICAAVPTTKALFRFCKNGFKHPSKLSSSYAANESDYTSSKKSYKSLQDSKGNSINARNTIGSVGQLRKRSSCDGLRMSSLAEAEGEGGFMELEAVRAPEGKGAGAIMRESEAEVDDASSGKAILDKYEYP